MSEFNEGCLSVYVYSASGPADQALSVANNIYRVSKEAKLMPHHAMEMLHAAKKLEDAARSLRDTAMKSSPFSVAKPERSRFLEAAE